MKTLKSAPNQFFAAEHLPLPEPVQWPQHRTSYLPTRPLVPLSLDRSRRMQASFECSCGANPLNDPHNLAVYAGEYHPLVGKGLAETDKFSILNVNVNMRHRSTDLSTFDPEVDLRLVDPLFPARLLRLHIKLYRLLPLAVQQDLLIPSYIDNLRSVKVTDPESRLREVVEAHFPRSYVDQSRFRRYTHTEDDGYGQDQYDQEDWEGWNLIHRQDQVLMNPFPYIRARYDELRRDKEHRAVPPSRSIGSYHPALPSLHVISPGFFSDFPAVPTRMGDPAICRCGHITAGRSHVQHVYYAFVGRTVMRALEIHGQPWQEVAIGRRYADEDKTSSYRDQAAELYLIMMGNYDG